MAKSKSCVVLPFLIGLVASIVLGWWGFPKVLYSQKTQPIRFDHIVHVEDQGMECEDCHAFRDDGSFTGLPTNANCVDCHEDVQGDDPDEALFVAEYVEKEREVEWLVYQKQPDNAYFSHIAHKDIECINCHPDVANMSTPPVYFENRLTGYSKDTMKMWQCERCHAQRGTSNACFVCHK
ncbi:MAG: menaquinone reductase multiheme cytochrome c subunit QrcA [Desulfomicrobium sp.]|nr:menaquinone reductase multiheme cytochrome c subunit QrcA [Desulfomicrobium sp.]NLV96832.1 cytochrome c3 family protein [Desulfovibrionales bacterium]